MRTNQEHKNAALSALNGNWAPAVVATIVYIVLAVAFTGGVGLLESGFISSGALAAISGASYLLMFLFFGPLEIGYYNSCRFLLVNGESNLTENIFKSGLKNWLHNVWGYFLMTVFVLLWALLLIIPGIVMSFAYAMTPFILVENPEMRATDAIKKSRAMMKGHKFDLFYLFLSFTGWLFLGILTLGIGLFWLLPYMYTALASFYEDLKAEAETGYFI